MQTKARTYKQQIEDAEELASFNLAKYKKSQHAIEEADKRANVAEHALSKLKSKYMATNSLSDIHS